jgi:hypothetical protein
LHLADPYCGTHTSNTAREHIMESNLLRKAIIAQTLIQLGANQLQL